MLEGLVPPALYQHVHFTYVSEEGDTPKLSMAPLPLAAYNRIVSRADESMAAGEMLPDVCASDGCSTGFLVPHNPSTYIQGLPWEL